MLWHLKLRNVLIWKIFNNLDLIVDFTAIKYN